MYLYMHYWGQMYLCMHYWGQMYLCMHYITDVLFHTLFSETVFVLIWRVKKRAQHVKINSSRKALWIQTWHISEFLQDRNNKITMETVSWYCSSCQGSPGQPFELTGRVIILGVVMAVNSHLETQNISHC